MSPRVTTIALSLALSVAAGPPLGQSSAPPHRPAGRSGTVVVPDRFLRPWDPITVFFDRDLGPAAGGPEDQNMESPPQIRIPDRKVLPVRRKLQCFPHRAPAFLATMSLADRIDTVGTTERIERKYFGM